jgi:hypothetical protein
MGEYAEMMLDGTMCASCGEFINTGNGFPTYCRSCEKDQRAAAHKTLLAHQTERKKVQCVKCRSWVKAIGLDDHFRDAHGMLSNSAMYEAPDVPCPVCARKVRPNGLKQHLHDKHGHV